MFPSASVEVPLNTPPSPCTCVCLFLYFPHLPLALLWITAHLMIAIRETAHTHTHTHTHIYIYGDTMMLFFVVVGTNALVYVPKTRHNWHIFLPQYKFSFGKTNKGNKLHMGVNWVFLNTMRVTEKLAFFSLLINVIHFPLFFS